MLWVTTTIVYCARSSSISSSILAVATGSSAEHGSSIRITSGLMAIARAMHRRCCCPPETPVPGWSSRSEISSHSPARLRLDSTISSSAARFAAMPWIRGP
jgi:hypothetical protein